MVHSMGIEKRKRKKKKIFWCYSKFNPKHLETCLISTLKIVYVIRSQGVLARNSKNHDVANELAKAPLKDKHVD